jgi:hypothetical protein
MMGGWLLGLFCVVCIYCGEGVLESLLRMFMDDDTGELCVYMYGLCDQDVTCHSCTTMYLLSVR